MVREKHKYILEGSRIFLSTQQDECNTTEEKWDFLMYRLSFRARPHCALRCCHAWEKTVSAVTASTRSCSNSSLIITFGTTLGSSMEPFLLCCIRRNNMELLAGIPCPNKKHWAWDSVKGLAECYAKNWAQLHFSKLSSWLIINILSF